MVSHQHVSNVKKAGFSLLELLIVVSILAILAGTTISSFNQNRLSQSRLSATQHEMLQLKHALLNYQQDNFSFPLLTTNGGSRQSTADFSFLYHKDGHKDWDSHYQCDWRGPYMTGGNNGLVDIGSQLTKNGSGSPLQGKPVLVRAIADSFVLTPQSIDNGSTPCLGNDPQPSVNHCLLEWWAVGTTTANYQE